MVNGEVTEILQVTPNLTTQVITIIGTEPVRNGAPSNLTLGDTPLTVTSYSTTPIDNKIKSYRIDATLPNSFVPASYLLSLALGPNNGHGGGSIASYTFNVTIPTSAGAGDGGVPHGVQEFTTPGQNVFIVPSGVTRIQVEVWGAGGGGGSSVFCPDLGRCVQGGSGGAGGYSRTTMNVAGGDNVTITIGQAGSGGQSGSGGQAGGSSGVADGPSVVTSGGGGAGGVSDCPPNSVPDGSPGTPDPNAQIGRTCAVLWDPYLSTFILQTSVPAPGSVQPLGGFAGGSDLIGCAPGANGANGYVFIQW